MATNNPARPAATIVGLVMLGLALTSCGGGSAGTSSDDAAAAGQTTTQAATSTSLAPAGPALDILTALSATCTTEIAAYLADPKAKMRSDQCVGYDMVNAKDKEISMGNPQVIITVHRDASGFGVDGDAVTDLPVPARIDSSDTDQVVLGFETGAKDGVVGSLTISYNNHENMDKARGTAVVHKVAEIILAKATAK